MKFNEKLIKLRKAAGLSQEELGNRLDVASNYNCNNTNKFLY